MTITFDGSLFKAPLNAPYRYELEAAKWRKSSHEYFTNQIERVVPVVTYLSPELQELLLSIDSSYEHSRAMEPYRGYDIPVPKDAPPLFGFQKAAVEFIIDHKATLLAEEPGMGKSAIMACAANYLTPKRVLLICPSIAKYNWYCKEWPKWTTLHHLTVGVAEGSKFFPDTDVVIINFDILHYHKKRIQEVEWDLMIVDEAHRVNNAEARRTVMVFGGTLSIYPEDADMMSGTPMRKPKDDKRRKLKHKIPAIKKKRAIYATATPMNRPKNLWVLCQECDPTGLGKNWKTFHYRYCALHRTPFGWDMNGATNLEELGARLRSTFMVRHDPEAVLDLPPLKEDFFLLPPVKISMDEEQKFVEQNLTSLMGLAASLGYHDVSPSSSVAEFLTVIGSAIIDNVPQLGKPEFKPLFDQFAKVRKLTGVAKVPLVVDFIKDISEDLSRPIVVFGYHREVLETLREEFPGAAVIMGGMTAKARDREVDRFQNGETNIFLGNMDAAGEAVTLTRADLMAIAEPDWRGTTMIQVRKRIHRITQNNPCTVYYLASANSFDAVVADNGFSKIANIQETLDL
ncbi:MAG: SNF2-related protein [Hyphomicrobiaceae bacterium]